MGNNNGVLFDQQSFDFILEHSNTPGINFDANRNLIEVSLNQFLGAGMLGHFKSLLLIHRKRLCSL